MSPIVLESINQNLLSEFSNLEIKVVVFQMNGLGAPSPNGFPAYFIFQKNWSAMDIDVCNFVRDVLSIR